VLVQVSEVQAFFPNTYKNKNGSAQWTISQLAREADNGNAQFLPNLASAVAWHTSHKSFKKSEAAHSGQSTSAQPCQPCNTATTLA
jgi:hypothetical protein